MQRKIRIEKSLTENENAEWLSEKLESYRVGETLSIPMVKVFLNNVVVYGRDRVEVELNDTDARTGNKDESNSVAHQRMLIMDYADTQLGLSGEDIMEFVDDGYTGRNYGREAG